MRKMLAAAFVVILVAELSCGKNSPRGMAETMIGMYNGTYRHHGIYNTVPFDSTYSGMCEVRQGSKKKSILVNNIYFELYKGEMDYESGNGTLTISIDEPPTILLKTFTSPNSGVDTLEFSGTKVQ